MRNLSPSILQPLINFIRTEAASGVVLILAALFGLGWANSSSADVYFRFLELSWSGLTIHHWINDGLMTIFFFVIGMEIKREVVHGELRSWRKAALPVIGALGGMIVPALIYFLFTFKSGNTAGWAIPTATDIAFALGVLSFFGDRVPVSLRVFLLALAIADDLGAVIIIGTFLSNSGIHASLVGVLLGLLVRASSLEKLIQRFHPLVSYAIVPLFAFANAGISFTQSAFPADILTNSITLGVIFGLLFGKPLGVFVFSYFSVQSGIVRLDEKHRWRPFLGVSCLTGIGFTMAIFITNLSLSQTQIVYAKVGIFVASTAAAIFGCLILGRSLDDNRNLRPREKLYISTH